MLRAESLAAIPGEELTGKEGEHALNSTLPDALTFDTET